ncbi:class I SAM-dependent methyltransferase [Sphingomonas panacisoli]|nr:class I SAM-dependent methyltransferase [Sphingomonas panacisoli]
MAQENYGQDAPTVVRNLAIIGGAILLGAWTTGTGGLWFRQLPAWVLALRPTLVATGWVLVAMAAWMVVSSRWLKPQVLKSLLDQHAWRGDEAVLDIGCGRGLVAIAAARRAPHGYVTGIDLWQEVDLAGNSPAAIHANAVAAGVADRLTVDTGDARALPYPDASFDVVASMTAIHNIPDAAGRTTAIAEAWRVTRPGGQILIYDIRHARAYAAQLKTLGAVDIRMSLPILLWGVLGWRFAATKPA